MKNAEAAVKSVVAATPKIGLSAMGAKLPAAAFAVVVDCWTWLSATSLTVAGLAPSAKKGGAQSAQFSDMKRKRASRATRAAGGLPTKGCTYR